MRSSSYLIKPVRGASDTRWARSVLTPSLCSLGMVAAHAPAGSFFTLGVPALCSRGALPPREDARAAPARRARRRRWVARLLVIRDVCVLPIFHDQGVGLFLGPLSSLPRFASRDGALSRDVQVPGLIK
jgi:hypothetical protein